MSVVEVLVAALLLALVAVALGRALVTAERVARRARAVRTAGAVVAERMERWAAWPCGSVDGTRGVDGLRERWQVRVEDGLAVLVDSVAPENGDASPRASATAVAPCAP